MHLIKEKKHRELWLNIVNVLVPKRCILCLKYIDSQYSYPLCIECKNAVLKTQYAELAIKSRCKCCGKPLISTQGVCIRCRNSTYSFDSVTPMFSYSGDIRNIVLAYKMSSRRSLAYFFAELLYSVWSSRFEGRPIIPVPPRPKKLRLKGWDQVEDIVKVLEKKYSVPIYRVLKRTDGVEQKALDFVRRQANMKGKFYLTGNIVSTNTPVLFDDVFTTGATLSECALVIKGKHSCIVDAICIAAD